MSSVFPRKASIFTFLFILLSFYGIYSFLFVLTPSLGLSFLKYEMKPWVFVIHRLESCDSCDG